MRSWLASGLFAALALVLSFEIFVIAPRIEAALIVACLAWMAWPGIALVSRLLPARPDGRIAAVLIGPALGFGFSVFGLMLLWALGLQNWLALLLAPAVGWIVVLAATRWGVPGLRWPRFDRRDLIGVGVALLVVPLITFAAYDHVGEPTADGRAYRAYFTADFVWAMTVTSELAKGDVPPANPFLRDTPLRYYWMSHLLSGAVYRNVAPMGVSSEQVILINGVFYGLAFVAFLYGLARVAGGSVAFSSLAVLAGFTANSYEALERMLVFFKEDTPFEYVRMINIDAVTRWYYNGMPVDGLQRMLLYQPHHIAGYMLALTALWLVGSAEDVTETAVALWAGILLGLGFLFSTFTAIIVGFAVGLLYAYRLVQRRAWGASWQCALLGGLPVLVALATATALGYTDPRQGILLQFGVNPTAIRGWPLMLLLSFGPLLFAGIAALLDRAWIAREGAAAAALVVSAFFFYFMADVPDEGGVWVGWRSGHLLLIAFSVTAAAVLTRLWQRPPLRTALVAALIVAIVPAVPTVAIDTYNAQDITNRERVLTFPWTVVITSPEREALEWIRRSTPVDAVVQVAPRAHGAATWTYIQSFAERRSAAGEPGSMIPAQPYRYATESVTRGIFESSRPADALEMARFLGIDFIVVGPQDREVYRGAAEMFEQYPDVFVPVFKNSAVTVYDVRKR